MFLHVEEAKYIGGYRLELTFNTAEKKTVNLENELSGEIFEPLKDKRVFSDFFISHNTVEWKNGADFAPEFLYGISVPVDEPELMKVAEEQPRYETRNNPK